MGLGKDAMYHLNNYQDFCTECCNKCTTVPDGYCPSYCLVLQKGALIPFEKIQNKYIQYQGDINKVCRYIKGAKV